MSSDRGATPTISAVVPTRNRPAHIIACTDSILRTNDVTELIVVDQSDGAATATALSTLTDPRLVYVRSELRGASNGRNVGIERSHGAIVAFTDDDCRVRPDWASKLGGIFAADPDAAVVCGRVQVPETMRALGYAAEFEPMERDWRGRYPPPGRDWGLTANLAVRRSVLQRVGAFDPVLGAGAPLLSGEEPDFLFRVLSAGFKVVNAHEVQVHHLGLRAPGNETRDLWHAYAVGTAAALFKYVRLRDANGAKLYFRWLIASALRVPISVLRGQSPNGFRFLVAFLAGSVASCHFRVDPQRRLYVIRPASASANRPAAP